MVKKIAFLVVFCACLSFSQTGSAGKEKHAITFSKDVAPLFQKQCAACHRPGGTAPMSLLTFKEARPWAKSIREKVIQREMPPWHADPHFDGKFVNERKLSQAEINTIVAWVDGGSLKGDDKDLPAPLSFVENWRIGQPDAVLSMPQEYVLAAEGPDEYQYFLIPTDFKEDRWVQAAEAIPGNNKVVHHIIAFIQPAPRAASQKIAQANRPRLNEIIFYKDGTLMRVNASVPAFDNGCATPEGGAGILKDGSMRDDMPVLLCGQAPGRDADVWPTGYAKKLPAGAKILLQVHYAKNGSVERDRSKVGLIFAKEPPEKEIFTEGIRNHYFLIPPGADNHEVKACYSFSEDVHLISLMPHMHLRGKDMEIRAFYPNGKSDILLRVPRYSFSWQTTYYLKKPFALPQGTRIEVSAHFDNSAKNKDNPDPSKTVRWGDPTYDEMMIGWVDYVRAQKGSLKSSSSIGEGGPVR